jgi:hypothetical protein
VTGAVDRTLPVWQNFYVIVGSSGAALIGLQFVVMALIASARRSPPAETVHAFGTPTVVHLAAALIVAGIMSAPWPLLLPLSIALIICSLGGLAYCAMVVRLARRQTAYKPVWEDWLWYTTLPCGMYAILAAAAALLQTRTMLALFGIGASALGLLLIGIHNAWDSVTHIVTTQIGGGDPADK